MGGNWTASPLAPAAPRTVTDGHATAGSATITSATASFSQNDVGGTISGTGIPAFETILSVTNSTTAVMTTTTTTTGGWTITGSGSPRTMTDGTDLLRSLTDGHSTLGSSTITSATACFSLADVGGSTSRSATRPSRASLLMSG
jgi:hypothetical protein